MADTIDDLVLRWRQDPSPTVTIALCDALRGTARAALMQQVGDFSAQRHSNDVAVMLAVARMYLGGNKLAEAQGVLVAAGKIAPREGEVYRWLGETLLRRGDADRAEKVLERSVQLGTRDPDARLWLERARVFRPMQAKAGARAVAAEVAHVSSMPQVPAARAAMDSYSDTTTMVRDMPPQLRDEIIRSGRENGARGPSASSASLVQPAPPPAAPAPPPAEDDEEDEPTAIGPRESFARAEDLAETQERAPDLPPLRRHFAQDADTAPAFTPLNPPPPSLQRPPSVDVEFSVQAPVPTEPAPRKPPSKRPAAPPPAHQLPPLSDLGDTLGDTIDPFARGGRKPAPSPDRPGPPAPPDSAGPLVPPHPRDILDALALAGVFEPPGEGSAAVRWERGAKQPRRIGSWVTMILGTLLLVGGGIGAFYYVKDVRAKEHAAGLAVIADVQKELQASRASSLDHAKESLSRAFDLESRSPGAALEWLHERALRGLLVRGSNPTFEEGLARAKEVEVPDDKTAFARVASFLSQGDTVGALTLLPTWDERASGDPWYELLTGSALERAGDERAQARFAGAVSLDKDFVAARVANARWMSIEGDPKRAMDLALEFRKDFPDRVEGAALVLLAWAHGSRGEGAAPVDAQALDEASKGAAELPASLAFVPPAINAIIAASQATPKLEEARSLVAEALKASDGPGVATWLGNIALYAGDVALARKAAFAAVGFSAVYKPARMLAARVAVLTDRLDEAFKATDDLDPSIPDVALVRAAISYERIEPGPLETALSALTPDGKKAPDLASLLLAPPILAGKTQLTADKILDLADDRPAWSDLLAMDVALDTGDLDTAGKIAAVWGAGKEDRPLRALRLARLLRYQGKAEDAEAMIQVALRGTVTARVAIERALILLARGKAQEVAPFLAKYSAAVGAAGQWLGGYAVASGGKADEAKGKTSNLDIPPDRAPLPLRVVAAAALGAMKDKKRGIQPVAELLQSGARNPDVVLAATSLDFKRFDLPGGKTAWEAPAPPP